MADADSIKCPQCDAPLNFDAEQGLMSCDHCGYSAPVQKAQPDDDIEFDAEGIAKQFEVNVEQFTDVDAYVCENCGAAVVATELTATTTCPYCNNNVVLDDRLSGGLKPNAVIPFKITKDELPELLQKFYKDKPLLPKDYFAKNKVEKAQGMYVPFWLFSGVIDGKVSLNASNTKSVITGKTNMITTSHYVLHREGNVTFKRVPADASSRMDNDVMDSVEPFDYDDLVKFDIGYLAGYVAERFDEEPKEVIQRAATRMSHSAADIAYTDNLGVGGYDNVEGVRDSSLELQDASVSYVMMPVYLFNTEYEGTKYRYAINGQTGKVVGEVPTSRSKAIVSFLVPFAITAAAVFGALVYGLLA